MKEIKQSRVAVYLQVSPASGSKQHNHNVLSQLERNSLSFCEAKGLHVDSEHIYQDICFRWSILEKDSGLSALLSAIKRDEFDVVVIPSTNQLPQGKNLLKAYMILKESGVRVMFQALPYDLADQCKEALAHMLFAVDEIERRIQDERQVKS